MKSKLLLIGCAALMVAAWGGEVDLPKYGTWIEKTSNNGQNAMFPKNWDAARVQAEIDSAWEKQRPHPKDQNMWIGISKSGVEIEGYKILRTTASPVYGGK